MPDIHVFGGRTGPQHLGHLRVGGLFRRCALGRSGVTSNKREGDGATPRGVLRPLWALYRPDRGPRPAVDLAVKPIRPDDGWCDDPNDRRYNRPVGLPFAGRHEKLWREDRLYDVVVVLDHNMGPVAPGAGSAIFLHVAAPGFTPTEGCIALAPNDLQALLAWVSPTARFIVR